MNTLLLEVREHKLDFPILGCLYKSKDMRRWACIDSAYKLSIVLASGEHYEYKGLSFVDSYGMPLAGIKGINGYKYVIPTEFMQQYCMQPKNHVSCVPKGGKELAITKRLRKYYPYEVKHILTSFKTSYDKYLQGLGPKPDIDGFTKG
jgi:hypothetical protein